MKIPTANIKGTPLEGVKFFFADITPELAAELLKANTTNRRLKENTVEAYMMDMKNGEWQTTHQGLAFGEMDAKGFAPLRDGQHRLHGIVRSKTTQRLLVSVGWPEKTRGRTRTMDAVDRGVQRSLPDQIHLQHGFPPKEASRVVQIANAIAACSFGLARVRKATAASVLAVLEIYRAEVRWVMEADTKDHGLRKATIVGCVAMVRALDPEKAADFWTRLRTGENLTRTNPILPLRNWLLGSGQHASNTEVRDAVLHHFAQFAAGRELDTLVANDDQATVRVLTLLGERTRKICAIYKQPLPVALRVSQPAAEKKIPAGSPEAVKIGLALKGVFTALDLRARVDGEHAGQWLLAWRNWGWIESSGTGFIRTGKFGQPAK